MIKFTVPWLFPLEVDYPKCIMERFLVKTQLTTQVTTPPPPPSLSLLKLYYILVQQIYVKYLCNIEHGKIKKKMVKLLLAYISF